MIKTIKHGYNLLKHKLRDVGVKNKRSPQWHKVREEFLTNNLECAVCGTNKNLNVHHKKPFHLYPQFELDPNNLITLCMDPLHQCHIKLGHGGDFKKYNPNVDEDVKSVHANIALFEQTAVLAKKNALKE